jgi:hypothetical protein
MCSHYSAFLFYCFHPGQLQLHECRNACFDYKFADVLMLSAFADILITSAGCLSVIGVSAAKQKQRRA